MYLYFIYLFFFLFITTYPGSLLFQHSAFYNFDYFDFLYFQSIIDILKIDIEGAEWQAIPPILSAGIHKQVKQLLIEIHAGRKGPRMNLGFWGDVHLTGQLRVLRLLYESGFRIFMREHNMYSLTSFSVPPQNQITIVNEISLVNIDFNQHT